MFSTIAYCTLSPPSKSGVYEMAYVTINRTAQAADILVAVALLVIGILATQTNLLPNFLGSNTSWLILGVGIGLTLHEVARGGLELKHKVLPHKYLF